MIGRNIEVSMSLDKANYYNNLEVRDKMMPVLEVKWKDNEGDEHSYYKCPACGEYVHEDYKFCRTCGQRLDMENIAL